VPKQTQQYAAVAVFKQPGKTTTAHATASQTLNISGTIASTAHQSKQMSKIVSPNNSPRSREVKQLVESANLNHY